MNGRVTSLDVATRAGVSRSAVSRVFTPGASVSAHTAEKVRAAADALGYRPNVLARSLLTGKSRIIGLVVAYLDNHFYPGALERLSAALEQRGYHVLVFMASQTAGNIEEVAQDILAYQVDGLVLASVALSGGLSARCRDMGVPVVLFNRRQDDPGLLAVTSDNYGGARLIAQHLVSAGAQRIAHIAGWEGASTQSDREAGFLTSLSENGQSLYAREVGDFHPETAKAAARRMFDRVDRPDAVFVANDYMAFMVMDVLRAELGLRVPQDVLVAGFDDVPTAAWPAYALTTVRQDAGAMVERVVEVLMAQIEGGQPSPPAPLPVTLVVRGSTRQ